MATLVAIETIIIATKTGAPRVIQAGDFVDAKDPVVKKRKDMFRPLDDVVEAATAAPGEKRNVKVPK